ncbi:MAG: exodeoxyribonuclease VII large subunit [Chlamydiales bacterium]|jgi:exodeoxyribonuclease VII large subunit
MTANPVKQETPILTVSEISLAIKQQLESNFRFVCIQGEISNFRRQSSGHLYFSLKDSSAQISCVMFKGSTSTLNRMPKEGDSVIIKGELSVYAPHGKYQVVVKRLDHAGLGELLLKLEQLKRDIHKRGWFDKENKKPLPKSPKRIGVITSPTGAVIQDILNVLTRRYSGFHLILNPVRVQGIEAPGEIAKAIEQFNEHDLVDVMIIGRGGGSIEDLWAFNEEIVASAIFHSRIPIIAAVGHETDHTIAEYVADLRAPTPSAAAEVVAEEKAHQIQALSQIQGRLSEIIMHLIAQNRHRLDGLTRHPLFSSPYTIIGRQIQQVDDMRNSMDQAMLQFLQRTRIKLKGKKEQAEALKPTALIQHHLQKLRYWQKNLDTAITHQINKYKNAILQHGEEISFKAKINFSTKKERFEALVRNLKAIDPKNLLKKGYSIAFSQKDGSVIVSSRQVSKDDKIYIKVSDGKLTATIKEVE